MGRAKALLPWRGRTMIEHVVSVLRDVVSRVVVVTSEALELPPLDAVVVRDRTPKLGPLGGIREGLACAAADLAYVTSTDAPFLTAAFVERILSHGRAAAPVVDGFVQSLSAAYPTDLAPLASELIAANRMRPLFLLEAADYVRVPPDALPDLTSLRNFNHPEEYLAAVRAGGDHACVTVEFLGLARRATGTETLELDAAPLRRILRGVEERFPALAPLRPENGSAPYLVSLNGRSFVSDGELPVAPGERVIIMDAAAGG